MKVICIGRNYSEHAKELNNPVPDEPVFFLKPDTAVLKDNAAFYHPDFSTDIHHEVELVLRVSKQENSLARNLRTTTSMRLQLELILLRAMCSKNAKKKVCPGKRQKHLMALLQLAFLFHLMQIKHTIFRS